MSSDRYVPSREDQDWDPTDCPVCGEPTKYVPGHIRRNCDVARQIRLEMGLPEGGVRARDDEEAW